MMQEIYYPQLEERLFRGKLPNGLPILVLPKPGFSRRIAYFVTDFGSIHTDFFLDGQEHHVPAGVAHYLEHKLFEMPDRDISEDFAALGGNPNAFTSYDMTAYYFSCTENFSDNLRLLLRFVSTPCFTEESVKNEQGIIGQEIAMCDDESGTQLFEELVRCLYRQHPVAVPILGTQKSIRRITPQVLELCHRAFYTPKNMLLCVVGDVDPQEVYSIALDCLPAEAPMPAVKLTPQEPDLLRVRPGCQKQMEVSMPTFQLGAKCPPIPKGEDGIRQEIIGDLAAEALFGESSGLYLRLYDEGLIDSSFGGGMETLDGAAMLLCGGDSEDPQTAADAIQAELQRIAREGIDEDGFQRSKKSALGRRIRDLDSFESTCFRLCAFHFTDYDYLNFPEVYASITRQEVESFLQAMAKNASWALSVIYPTSKEDS